MQIGIVGLPNVGKSTLFNAITKAGAECANYPFCTIEPNVGIVSVPDERLNVLAKMVDPAKITPAVVEFVDIAGLVKGASKGEGLGNKFLSHIREVEAIAHVVRCFDDTDVIHVEGSIDPLRDIDTVNLELILADLDAVERRLEKCKRMLKVGDKEVLFENNILEKIKKQLDSEKPVRMLNFTDDERAFVRQLQLLSDKPVIYVANVSENELGEDNEYVRRVTEFAKRENAQVIVICAQIEAELAALDDEEKIEYLNEMGMSEPGLNRLIKASYKLLGLINYFTAGPKEVRAWTIVNGTKAPQAAGKIHTDFEKGFIRAEVISYDDLIKSGSQNTAKDKGLMRLEGKDYVMKDGDVVVFRFNV